MRKLVLLLLFFVNVLTAQQRFYPFDTVLDQQKHQFSKQETIDAIKSYYDGFKTGSYSYAEDNEKAISGSDNYTKFTENYKAEINNCNFKMSYDVYDLTNNEIENTTTIELNLNEVKNLKKGKNEESHFKKGSKETLNRNILFQMINGKKIKVTQRFKGKTISKEITHFEIKIYPNYDAYPNQKHPDFKDDLIVNYFNQLVTFCKTNKI